MESERIFEALQGVDEELLERSGIRRRRKPHGWMSVGAAAACLCAVVGISIRVGMLDESGRNAEQAAPEAAFDMEKAAAEAAPKAAEEKAAEGQADGASDGALRDLPQQAGGSGQEDGLSGAGGSGQEDGLSGAGGSGQEDGLSGAAGSGQEDGLLGAAGQAGAGDRPGSLQNHQAEKEMAGENRTPLEQADQDCLQESQEELITLSTAEELYAQSDFAAYLPGTLPEGYRFESGRICAAAGGKGTLFALWSRGMDTIELFVDRNPREAAVTDISQTEAYDVNLYEIPYSESVPLKYQEFISHPVFRREDLSLKVIQARTRVVADGGDTSTPLADFGILYEDGTLATLHARASAEEIWAMLGE